MTELLTFIRHGQTHNNTGNYVEKDTRLTEQGKDMCCDIDGEYDLVICSTLWRAKETLLCTNLKYGRLIYSDLCRERMNGSADNYQIREEIQPESKEQFTLRCKQFQSFLQEMSWLYPRICVISHSGTLSKLTNSKFKNADVWDTTIDEYLRGYSISL